MSISIAVNPPKTPVTEGSEGKAPATVPNVCKMPGPPAPFVPTPLPNIGRSGDSIDGYTTTVLFEDKKVAIKGATFKSTGSPDAASKATGGGVVSSVEEGKTGFAAPGSMDVKAEGKNIQLLGDAMMNNGNVYNAAAVGELQPSKAIQSVADKLCDEFCKKPKPPSRALEKRLAKEGVDNCTFATDTAKKVGGRKCIPDCVYKKGNVTQCFDFKFPGDRWRKGQRRRQRAYSGRPGRPPITISRKSCGC
jgi:hypothetical protein